METCKTRGKNLKKKTHSKQGSFRLNVLCYIFFYVLIFWFIAASFTLSGNFFQSSAISTFIFTFNWHHGNHFDPAFLLNCRLWKAASEFEHWTASNTMTFHPHEIMFSLKSAGCSQSIPFVCQEKHIFNIGTIELWRLKLWEERLNQTAINTQTSLLIKSKLVTKPLALLNHTRMSCYGPLAKTHAAMCTHSLSLDMY